MSRGPVLGRRPGRLWWSTSPARMRWRPGTEAPRRILFGGHGPRVPLWRCADGLYFLELKTRRLDCFCRPEAKPARATAPTRAMRWAVSGRGTMQNNLNPDGSSRPMTRHTGGLLLRAAQQQQHARTPTVSASPTRSPGRRSERIFGDTLANLIWAFDCDLRNRAARQPTCPHEARGCQASATARPSTPRGHLWNARFAGGAVVRLAPDGRVEQMVGLRSPTRRAAKTLYVITSARFTPATDH